MLSSMRRSTLRIIRNAPSSARSSFGHGARAFAAALLPPRSSSAARVSRSRPDPPLSATSEFDPPRLLAHGDAVNVAARLEACNKELGSAICIGPAAAARCDAALLRPLGQLAIRGRAERIAAFEPWPSDALPAWREAYLAAYAILDSDAAYAAVLLQKLIAERPADLAVRRLAERLPPMRKSDRSPT